MYCQNYQQVKNRYTGETIEVPCGVCKVCRQEYANRMADKIRNEVSADIPNYFVTLTYTNSFLPFVKLNSNGSCDPIIYRGEYDQLTLEHLSDSTLSKFDDQLHLLRGGYRIPKFPHKDCVGVLYHRDLTLFFKQLRNILYRKYHVTTAFKYFAIGEYGETTYRPHFHVLFSTKIPREILRKSIMSAWTYQDYRHIERWFEDAIEPAAYLSNYITDASYLPPFYRVNLWRIKKTHSLNYGFKNPAFTLENFYASVSKGKTYYRRSFIAKNGYKFDEDVPFPLYVVRRFFPTFKGCSRMSFHEYLCIAYNAKSIRNQSSKTLAVFTSSKVYVINQMSVDPEVYRVLSEYRYNEDDLEFAVRAFNRMKKFASTLNVDYQDYLQTAYDYAKHSHSYMIKSLHRNDKNNYLASFRYYKSVPECISPLTYMGDDGVYNYDRIRAYMKRKPLAENAAYYERISDNSKMIRKVKYKTIERYKLLSYEQ